MASTPESQEAVEDLTKLTIQRLRMMANSLGVKGTNTMTKIALREAIQERKHAEKPEEPKPQPRPAIDPDDLAGKLGNRMAPIVAQILQEALERAVVSVCSAIWEAYGDLAKKQGKEVPTPENDRELVMATTALIAQVSLSIDRLGIVGTKVDSVETAITELLGRVEDLKRAPEQERKEEERVPSQYQLWWQRILRMSGRIWTSAAYYLWDPNRRATQ